MEKLAKRIRNSNKQYFDAGVDAGTQKACDLLLVAAYECGFVRTPEKAKKSNVPRERFTLKVLN